MTLEEFIGGSLSASYTPNKNDQNYSVFLDALNDLFVKHHKNNQLQFPNKTYSYTGKMQ